MAGSDFDTQHKRLRCRSRAKEQRAIFVSARFLSPVQSISFFHPAAAAAAAVEESSSSSILV